MEVLEKATWKGHFALLALNLQSTAEWETSKIQIIQKTLFQEGKKNSEFRIVSAYLVFNPERLVLFQTDSSEPSLYWSQTPRKQHPEIFSEGWPVKSEFSMDITLNKDTPHGETVDLILSVTPKKEQDNEFIAKTSLPWVQVSVIKQG
jgi:hypothetical protein